MLRKLPLDKINNTKNALFFLLRALYCDKTQMLKKFPSEKINVTKNALFFPSQAPPHHSFTFMCGIFHFRFRFVFIRVYIFAQQNA